MALSALGGVRDVSLPQLDRQAFEREVLQAEGPVLVNLYKRDLEDRLFVRALTEVLREQNEDLRFVSVGVDDIADLIDTWRKNKGYHAYNLDKLPAAALFRKGELVTTFNPIVTTAEPEVRRSVIKRQFRRFLEKFIHYDPEKLTFNHKQD